MSQLDTLRQMDADMVAAFRAAGIADACTYTAPGGTAVACDALVDRDVRMYGDDEAEVATLHTLVTLFRAQIGVPQRGAVVAVGDERFTLDGEVKRDESQSRWVVTRA